MAATIKDIAKKTGLGLATISSYLNGGNVREQNRIKIEEAIDDKCVCCGKEAKHHVIWGIQY